MRMPLHSAKRNLDAIVLAAGGSTRLGRPKQLLTYQRAPLIVRTARLARRSVRGRVIVVLGDQQQRLRSLLRRRVPGVIVVTNSGWRAGLSTSLKYGLKRVTPTASACLVLLVDQARIEAADLARLITGWRERPALPAAASYGGRAGVPAVIPRMLFDQVRALEGDCGARELLRRVGEISLVEMPAAEFDIDTPADAALLAR